MSLICSFLKRKGTGSTPLTIIKRIEKFSLIIRKITVSWNLIGQLLLFKSKWISLAITLLYVGIDSGIKVQNKVICTNMNMPGYSKTRKYRRGISKSFCCLFQYNLNGHEKLTVQYFSVDRVILVIMSKSKENTVTRNVFLVCQR